MIGTDVGGGCSSYSFQFAWCFLKERIGNYTINFEVVVNKEWKKRHDAVTNLMHNWK